MELVTRELKVFDTRVFESTLQHFPSVTQAHSSDKTSTFSMPWKSSFPSAYRQNLQVVGQHIHCVYYSNSNSEIYVHKFSLLLFLFVYLVTFILIYFLIICTVTLQKVVVLHSSASATLEVLMLTLKNVRQRWCSRFWRRVDKWIYAKVSEPEDGNSMFLRNVVIYLRVCTAQNPEEHLHRPHRSENLKSQIPQ
jgi:hypothetical protein